MDASMNVGPEVPGVPAARRQFTLPEDDREHLDTMGCRWEAVSEGSVMWLHIHDHPIPMGYNVGKARVALRLMGTYPEGQIDMVYFSPSLSLLNGKAIAALSATTIDGAQFQQWSRHRTSTNPWRPGVDNIGTHLLQVRDWLEREARK